MKPIGPYSAVRRYHDLVFVSGQIAPEAGVVTEQTKQVMMNIQALLNQAGSELKQVVKTTLYLTDINDFAAVNEVYATFFEEPYPARATVQVAALPKGAAIEIDCIAQILA